ncbi:hypothetical protein MHBO_004469 [Bonamia ostreae]|uniref:30S ribosomal protein S16 n=1 Tax=Bonamia ostreae TaxID=126728 RepID=A0ABV2ATF1_9EUKA
MAVVIRLSRRGNKHKPFYRIVVAKSTSPVKGKCIENVGTYNSIQNKDGFKELRIVEDRIKYWLAVGAKLSSTVHKLLSNAGILHELLYVIYLMFCIIKFGQWNGLI